MRLPVFVIFIAMCANIVFYVSVIAAIAYAVNLLLLHFLNS